MSAKLTNGQKRQLSQENVKAFRFLGAKARGRGEPWPQENKAALDAFRHEQVALACGKPGLRCCSQSDFADVKAHYEDLLGEPGKAMATLVRGADNERRIWEHKLWRVTQEAEGLGWSRHYWTPLFRSKFKTTVLEADAATLRKMFYEINHRLRARRKAQAA